MAPKYAPKDKGLEKLEPAAMEARRGLWADRDPIPPWEFRRNRSVAAVCKQSARPSLEDPGTVALGWQGT